MDRNPLVAKVMSALYQTNMLSWIFIVKQRSASRHGIPLRHIILIRSKPVFALTL